MKWDKELVDLTMAVIAINGWNRSRAQQIWNKLKGYLYRTQGCTVPHG